MLVAIRLADGTQKDGVALPEAIAVQVQAANVPTIFAGREMSRIVDEWLQTQPEYQGSDCITIYEK